MATCLPKQVRVKKIERVQVNELLNLNDILNKYANTHTCLT